MENIDLLRQTVTTNLLQTGRHWRRAATQVLGHHGISEACASPLIWISRMGGGTRQVVLAHCIGIESASLVRLLDQLEANNLIERKADPSDRRAKCIWLTQEGQELATKMEALLIQLRSRILANVTREDLEATLRVFQAFDDDTSESVAAPAPASQTAKTAGA
ncbi:MarR family winged helix-turn-helix transcriptional regulator [Thalassospira sp. MCCC 1A01428]|uniref:MarR family winged helix-turn-helix transcriptional regulator n=1 Tax=Thalassospira sp. MCCC 1A01428 TaxID=1470575 RepID=UPI000A1DB5AF|nr:MarR family transcriptional regulator [Thalassospira sp. MCCC 1A01428]OSQ42203.1 MarR family transcriptional regulator [Thalassospira sp. MCCC 1A01428]